jgi:putative ubiquitin-RnfH superfamily antitoxin RatB of RatAB toxin-antitoxin module
VKVSVVYALPGAQFVREVELSAGGTLAMAVECSGLLQEFPEIGGTSASFGVYGRVMPPYTILQPGDRVEIYRQLLVAPAEARRKRVRKR